MRHHRQQIAIPRRLCGVGGEGAWGRWAWRKSSRSVRRVIQSFLCRRSVTLAAVAREVSVAVVAAGERASGAAALEPSSGATSLQDFAVSRVLSSTHLGHLRSPLDQLPSQSPHSPTLRARKIFGFVPCLLILLPQDSHSKPGGHDDEEEHPEECQAYGSRRVPTRV